MELTTLGSKLDMGITQLIDQALKVVGPASSMTPYLLKTAGRQLRAAHRRSKLRRSGLYVPPMLIVSITNRCNLRCKGCYSAAQHRSLDDEISEVQFRALLKEAQELGISFALLAGGEPLVRPELLQVASEFSDIIFPVFTNGILLNDMTLNLLQVSKNIIPVVSIEGDESATDDRRGMGVFQKISERMEAMKRRGLFFGTSITVTNRNFDQVVNDSYVKGLIEHGAKLIFFVEYVPVDESTETLCLEEDQRKFLESQVNHLRNGHRAIFISFPGDEDEMGGCLAAGRGFVHISSRGDVEPCPFAPWSDANLSKATLSDALKSPFLAAIRENHDSIRDISGGCALWGNRDLVQSLLHPTSGTEQINGLNQ